MNSISSSLFWKFSERFGIQIVQFVLSIIIARLLTPAEYGIIAILMIFISIATIFVQSGLTSALIQKKDIRIADFSFVFFYSLLFALFLYAGLYCFAPYIATYFSLPDLVAIVRVASVVLFFGAFNSVQLMHPGICCFASSSFAILLRHWSLVLSAFYLRIRGLERGHWFINNSPCKYVLRSYYRS